MIVSIRHFQLKIFFLLYVIKKSMGNDDNFLLKDVAGNSEECGQKHWNGTSSPHNLTTFPQTGKWMV
jgi:hypothetical protein